MAPAEIGKRRGYEPLIPTIEGLTKHCYNVVSGLGGCYEAAWDSLVRQCEQEGKAVNVENILSKVRMKLDAVDDGETLVGLKKDELAKVEETICASIAKKVTPADNLIPDETPHDDFAIWVKKVNRTSPLEIFSLNYDLLFERAFELARVPLFDGFVGAHEPFFYPECLDDESQLPSAKWVRLWKLHGSVNWSFVERKRTKRLIRGRACERGEMILPSHMKYDESRKQPYIAYMDRLSDVLNLPHALLITCGYSFSDDHIKSILFTGLDNQNTSNTVALSFTSIKEEDDIVRDALKRRNFTVIAPNAAVISGVWGTWQLTQPVDHKTHSFMDIAFDSNAEQENGGDSDGEIKKLTGEMRLGDFNWFCRFLTIMSIGLK
jgi:hypothetical protein